MLTSNLVPCFVQTFKTDSKTGYEKALLVGVFDKTTTDLDCCISSSRNVIIDDSYEVFDMYSWTFNENDITEQLGFQRKEDE